MEVVVSVPDEVCRRIDQALAAMRNSPSCELKPIYRVRLYDALRHAEGRSSRARLDIITVRRVLPLWKYPWPERADDPYKYSELPERMVRLAEGLLAGMATRAEAEDVANLAGEMTILTGYGPSSRYYLVWCVFDAAYSALIEALGDDSLAGSQISKETCDDELRSFGDAARWSAIAAAGGSWRLVSEDPEFEEEVVQWDFSSNVVRERRRDFWEWWLHEATQAAQMNGSGT